jgi:rhodanese-related sulfurtransferase
MRFRSAKMAIVAVALSSVAILAGACSPAVSTSVTDVTAAQAHALIVENEGNDSFVVLDVRTPAEFSEGHVANAVNIDVNASSFRSSVAGESRTDTYLVYCRSGNRSLQAIGIMKELGFQKIYHMAKGIQDWISAGFPTVTP